MAKIKILTLVFSYILSVTVAFAGPYDGDWVFIIKTQVGSGCSASPGKVSITNGKIKGSLKTEGTIQRVRGKIKDDGTFKGTVGRGLAFYEGKATPKSGSGTWKNSFGCRGTVTIRK